MLSRGDIQMLDSSVGVLNSFIEHGVILLDRETAVVAAIILAALWLVKSLLELGNSKLRMKGSKIKSIKMQLELERSFDAERAKYLGQYEHLQSLLEELKQKVMDSEALYQLSCRIYDALVRFLRDYSSYLMQYAFIQKHGFKNKIKLAVVIDDVYHCIELYQMIYTFFQEIDSPYDTFFFDYSQIKPLVLFVNSGIGGKVRNLIYHREVLQIKNMENYLFKLK